MGKRAVCLVVGLAACGSSSSKPADAPVQMDAKPDAMADAKVFNDAPPDAPPMYNLSCIGNPAPTTATANVTISGTVREASVNGTAVTLNPLAGATVDTCTADCATPLATATTDTAGAFSDGPIATGSKPLAAYLRLTKTNDATVREYTDGPFTADFTGLPMFTITDATLAELNLAGLCKSTAAQSILAVLVTDCAQKPITDSGNTVITVKQGGTAITIVPVNLGQFSAMAAGTYLYCGVTPDASTVVSVSYKSMTFLDNTVAAVANVITAAQVRPGY